MPSDVTITARKIHLEDLEVTTNPAGATSSVNVLGAATNPVTLTQLALVLLTQFEQAANDVGAAAAGVALGDVYYCTANSKLKARLT